MSVSLDFDTLVMEVLGGKEVAGKVIREQLGRRGFPITSREFGPRMKQLEERGVIVSRMQNFGPQRHKLYRPVS